jgi:hypothetical protein
LNYNRILILSSLALFFLTACGGGGGGQTTTNPGLASAAKTSILATSDPTCPNGGILVETGIDDNGNSVLDANEVDKSEKVCNGLNGTNGTTGANGLNALIRQSAEAAGANCSFGGVRFEVGIDTNTDGVLNASEITSTDFICHDTGLSYVVGGSLANYQGNGLMIAETVSGQVFYATSGGTTFSFSVKDGSNYNIIVGTQPSSPNEVCSVTNGSGTIAGATINNVALNCSINNYTVGGGVFGLNSFGLVLQNNATDNLNVNGTGFEFATPLADGSNYDVTVLTQPTAQDCSVKNGNGTLAGSNITAVDVICKGWRQATFIETNTTGNSTKPQIAFDNAGNALAVWQYYDGTRFRIWSNRYTAGSGWGIASQISFNFAGDAVNPQIAMDSAGNALLVWQQSDGTRFNIWSKRYTAGSSGFGWGIASLIETDNAGGAGFPQIAMDSAGNALAVWAQSDGTRANIWSNHYTAGAGWGTASLIETDNAGNALNPQIAIDSTGNALAVWFQGDGTRDNIWSNRYTAGAGWGTASLIETDNAGSAGFPQIAIDSTDNALAVWAQKDSSGIAQVWSNRYANSSGWGTATPIQSNLEISLNIPKPQISFDSMGNALAVWNGQFNGQSIFFDRYTAGTGWGTARLVEYVTGDSLEPQIAIDNNGNALAVWQQPRGLSANNNNNEIRSNRYE